NAVRSHYAAFTKTAESTITVIPIGIEHDDPLPRTPSPHFRLGIVARLVEQKGHRYLLEAVSKIKNEFPNIRLYIFGSGPLNQELKAMVRALQIENHVEFKGLRLDPSEIYSQIDVLVLPSLWEGAGNVLLEGMSFGIPIIASQTGGIPEYLPP